MEYLIKENFIFLIFLSIIGIIVTKFTLSLIKLNERFNNLENKVDLIDVSINNMNWDKTFLEKKNKERLENLEYSINNHEFDLKEIRSTLKNFEPSLIERLKEWLR